MDIPTFSSEDLRNIFKKRRLEDLEGMKFAEDALIKKRGYVFKMPAKKESVVVLYSGGLDSVTTCSILMDKFKLRVYPVFFKTGFERNKYEYEAAVAIGKVFSKKYGDLFQPIKVIDFAPLYPPVRQTKPVWNLSYDQLSNSIRCIYAMKYAYQLQEFNNVKIRTIFTCHISSDGEEITDQTLASLRKTMLYLCLGTGDYSWQLSALGLEKELGYFYGKDFEIAWCAAHGIPLELTRSSCYRNSPIHCGQCPYCLLRKESFKKAGVIDKTRYADEPTKISKFITRTKKKIKSYLR